MGFIFRRLLFYFGAFLVAVVINFILPRAMPGDPVSAMLAGGAMLDAQQVANLRETFGFNDGPLLEQFWTYLTSIFSWDLGVSTYFYPTPVTTILAMAFGWTLFLTGTATILAFCAGGIMGILAAWYRGGKFDSFASPFSLVLQATPQLVFGIIILFSLGVTSDWIPISYAYDPEIRPAFSLEWIASVAHHAIAPIFCIFIVQVGGFLVPMRNNMINLLGEDYITMGKAKGLSNKRVMLNYGARNAILPSVTALSMALGFVVGGAMVVEVIFNYPGLGSVLFNAINNRDYQLIQGQLLIMTLFMLSFNFLADVLYIFLDPRLRKGGK